MRNGFTIGHSPTHPTDTWRAVFILHIAYRGVMCYSFELSCAKMHLLLVLWEKQLSVESLLFPFCTLRQTPNCLKKQRNLYCVPRDRQKNIKYWQKKITLQINILFLKCILSDMNFIKCRSRWLQKKTKTTTKSFQNTRFLTWCRLSLIQFTCN